MLKNQIKLFVFVMDESWFTSIYPTYKKSHTIKGKDIFIPINENRPSTYPTLSTDISYC